jgi:hypothetical protein
MKTTPQPGTLLKLMIPMLIAYGAPNRRISAGELVMFVGSLGSDLFVMHASGVVATIPCGSSEFAIRNWFEELS